MKNKNMYEYPRVGLVKKGSKGWNVPTRPDNAGIGSDDGLVPFRQNAIVGTIDGLLLMHMCATRPKWVNVIFTPGFTVISAPLKGTWYVECLFCYAWMIIIKSLFSRKAGNRRLGGLSSLVATWVVITTTCGANSDEISGCRLDDLLFAVLLLTEYLHPFYCDIYITEICMKILYIVLLCLETSLSLHLFLFSPKEASTISQFLSSPVAPRFGFWQCAVPPVTMG